MLLDKFIVELEASSPAARKQALGRLKAMMNKDSALDSQDGCSYGFSLWRLLVAALLFSLTLLFVAPSMGERERACTRHFPQVRGLIPKPLAADSMPLPLSRGTDSKVLTSNNEAPGQMGKIRYRGDDGKHVVAGRNRYPRHPAFDHPRDAIRRLRPMRNTSDFPLLLCVGHGKTATKSLNKALFMLGYNTAHFYGAGVYSLLYDNAAEDRYKEFLFNVAEAKHVDAVLDTPVVDFYNEILLSYPNARVVLTVRRNDGWLKSQQSFYAHYSHSCKNWLAPWRRGSNLVFGTECPSPAQAMKRYLLHNRAVVDAVPQGRLLVMDIPGGDGWEKLCPFLGIPVPNKTFPNRH